MTSAEAKVRERWQAFAVRVFFGRCDDCGRIHDDDGKPLLVARQPRCRRFQCVGCFDQNPTGPAARR